MSQKTILFLENISHGKQEEIVLLYQKIFPKIERYVLRNNGRLGDADDIFQRALLQLIVRYRIEPFDIHTSFENYFFMVCKNLWRRELNSNRLTIHNSDLLNNVPDETDNAFAIVEQERHDLFTEKLAALSDNCKQLLQLFFKKTPYDVLMRKFNYNSENVVRQRIFKCKNRLVELIKKDNRYDNLKDV